jgi:hypothetical protein
MDGDLTKEGFGVVQLGEVTSYGQWKVLDGQIEMSFESRSLSLEKQADLEHYRNSSQPLQVQLPGDRRPAWGIVIGFQRNDRIATFYVTLPPRKKNNLIEFQDGSAPPIAECRALKVGRGK